MDKNRLNADATVALLRTIDILVGLPDATLSELAASVVLIQATAGEVIFRQLDRPHSVFLVFEGVLRSKILTPMGREVFLRTIGAGDLVGGISAAADSSRTATVIAETDAKLGEIPSGQFFAFATSRPPAARALMRVLARHALSLTNRVFELVALEVRSRIYSELLRLAEAAASPADEPLRIAPRPTHADIARMVGTGREAITRELGSLARDNIVIRTRDALIIQDPTYLRDFLRRRTGDRSLLRLTGEKHDSGAGDGSQTRRNTESD